MPHIHYFIREAWQSLRRRPGYVFSVVVTMGLTTGALVCVATLGYLLLVKPLPYQDQENLFRVDHRLASPLGDKSMPAFTFPGIMHLYENEDVFLEKALISYGNDVISSIPNQPAVSVAYVSPEWFHLFNARFELGRGFEETEAPGTNNPVAILSHETWTSEYGSDPDILDRFVSLSGIDYRIVGVVSDAYVEPQILGPGSLIGVWIPWDYNFGTRWREQWTKFTASLTFVGKLRDTVSASQAQQSVGAMVNDTWRENVAGLDFFTDHRIEIEFRSFRDLIVGDSTRSVYLLFAATLGLVVIAAANITNLFMSRTAQQEQSLAIRAAVGAGRGRVYRTLIAESGLLMTLSGLLSLLVAAGGFHFIRGHLAGVLPRVAELSLGVFSFVTAALMAALLAALFARFSLGIIDFKRLNASLQSSGKGNAIQVSRRVRQILISSQVCIALALVFVNVSLFQSAYKTITMPLGYDVEDVYDLTLSYAGRSRPPLDEVAPIMDELRSKLLLMPEVKALTQSSSPLAPGELNRVLSRDSENRLIAEAKGVDHSYFEFVAQTLLEGSYFSATDSRTGEYNRFDTVIVNEALARAIESSGSALGVTELPGFGMTNVIGVVENVRRPGESEIAKTVYFPMHRGRTRLLIEMHENHSLSRSQVSAILGELGDDWSVWGLYSLEDRSRGMLFAQTATAVTTATLTVITCFLVGVGLYGVLSYSMRMRRFEIGIRMAIGAKGRDIVRMVFRENGRALFMGLIACLVLLLGLAALFPAAFRESLTLQSVPTFLVTTALVGLVTIVTSYLPIRRYTKNAVIHNLRTDH